MSEIHHQLLTADGMQRARDAVVKNHEWFIHASPVRHFDSIKKTGLQPRDPYREEDDGSNVEFAARRVVCLTPLPSRIDTRPKRGEQQFVVAIRNSDLPVRAGVDWSYDGQAGLIDLLREEAPERDIGDIFAEAADRWGCIVVFDQIPPEHLHLWTKGLPLDNPSGWPPLMACSFDDAATI